MAAFLPIFRLVALVFAALSAIIVLGLNASLVNLTETYYGYYLIMSALGIATAILTIVTTPVLITVDYLRRGAFTSMVVFELSWLSVLWVLWIATAADTADANAKSFPNGCDYVNEKLNTACHEFSAIEAFAFLAWIVLMAYTIVLLVFSIIGHARGNKIWLSTVRENNFLNRGDAPANATTTTTAPQFAQAAASPVFQGYPASHIVPPSSQGSYPQSSYPQV